MHKEHDTTTIQSSKISGRILKEVVLNEPIRYNLNDPIELWLNSLLCLNANDKIPALTGGIPHPSQCNLYAINRDTLFSYQLRLIFLDYHQLMDHLKPF